MCKVCGRLHGKRFKVSKAPTVAHPRCQCTLIPVIPDNWTADKKPKSVDKSVKSDIIKENNCVKLYDKNGKFLKSIPRPKVKLPDTSMSIITQGTNITDVEVFAGKGTRTELRVKGHLENNYGGIADNWQHSKGHAFVDTPNGSKKANVHWFEEETVGVVEMFVKGWSKK